MLQRNRYLLVLVSVPLGSHVAITCYGHIVTSSTTIPVDGRTNRTLSLPFTYFNPCSPPMAARLTAFRDESPLAGSKNNRQRPGSVSGAPQFNLAALAASVQLVRDLCKQVFVPKKQDHAEQSC